MRTQALFWCVVVVKAARWLLAVALRLLALAVRCAWLVAQVVPEASAVMWPSKRHRAIAIEVETSRWQQAVHLRGQVARWQSRAA
jgi:hypothetical protein